MTWRQRVRVYIQDVWNKCDLTAITLFIIGLICRYDCTQNVYIIIIIVTGLCQKCVFQGACFSVGLACGCLKQSYALSPEAHDHMATIYKVQSTEVLCSWFFELIAQIIGA